LKASNTSIPIFFRSVPGLLCHSLLSHLMDMKTSLYNHNTCSSTFRLVGPLTTVNN
jgi:hypothetical protein